MLKVTLNGEGGTASGYKLLLDGQDISNSVRAVHLDVSVDDVNTAKIEVYADKLDVTADVDAKLIDVTPETDERTTFASRFREWLGV